jgi:hypothetical protein
VPKCSSKIAQKSFGIAGKGIQRNEFCLSTSQALLPAGVYCFDVVRLKSINILPDEIMNRRLGGKWDEPVAPLRLFGSILATRSGLLQWLRFYGPTPPEIWARMSSDSSQTDSQEAKIRATSANERADMRGQAAGLRAN